jgi:hypothetical protein
MGAPLSPLSSRAEPRDLQCALRPSRILRNKLPILEQKCHPDRSGGTCCSRCLSDTVPILAHQFFYLKPNRNLLTRRPLKPLRDQHRESSRKQSSRHAG